MKKKGLDKRKLENKKQHFIFLSIFINNVKGQNHKEFKLLNWLLFVIYELGQRLLEQLENLLC